MTIPSIAAGGSAVPETQALPPEGVAQRQKLLQAAKSINASGALGENQIVFVLDRATHHIIIRLEDRNTHEVVLQVPPEYVLRLAKSLDPGSSHTIQTDTDT